MSTTRSRKKNIVITPIPVSLRDCLYLKEITSCKEMLSFSQEKIAQFKKKTVCIYNPRSGRWSKSKSPYKTCIRIETTLAALGRALLRKQIETIELANKYPSRYEINVPSFLEASMDALRETWDGNMLNDIALKIKLVYDYSMTDQDMEKYPDNWKYIKQWRRKVEQLKEMVEENDHFFLAQNDRERVNYASLWFAVLQLMMDFKTIKDFKRTWLYIWEQYVPDAVARVKEMIAAESSNHQDLEEEKSETLPILKPYTKRNFQYKSEDGVVGSVPQQQSARKRQRKRPPFKVVIEEKSKDYLQKRRSHQKPSKKRSNKKTKQGGKKSKRRSSRKRTPKPIKPPLAPDSFSDGAESMDLEILGKTRKRRKKGEKRAPRKRSSRKRNKKANKPLQAPDSSSDSIEGIDPERLKRIREKRAQRWG